ncbi:MAG: MBL fold metallo-hydrolase [Chlamydiia bacterium]|nr:MBL fold metallo-hydrolase [Chlamydiia bacterium]
MIIKPFPTGPFATNAYIVACPATSKALIIDPGFDSSDLLQAFLKEKGLTPEKILLTHSHWDHFGDAKALKEKLNIPLFVHPLDADNVRRPGTDGLPLFTPMEGFEPDGTFTEGDRIECGTLKFEVIETPGHTPGGVSFYEPQQKVLLSGDTLFQGTIGNLSFPGCSAEKMWQSLKKLAKLPGETQVFPGHGPQTTIADEPWLDQAETLFS